MMKKTSQISAFIALSIIVLIGLLYSFYSTPKIGFIDYNEVYNNCRLKKELEKDLIKAGSKRKSHLDSLQIQLNYMNSQLVNGGSPAKLKEFEDTKNMYFTLQENYEKEHIQTKETYFNQIQTDISDKASLFAEKNGYDMFLSDMSDGNFLYGGSAINATKEFQEYLEKI